MDDWAGWIKKWFLPEARFILGLSSEDSLKEFGKSIPPESISLANV